MRKRLTLLAALLFALTLPAQRSAQLAKAIEKILRNDTGISLEQTPGLVIGVVEGDSTWVFAFGSVSKTEQRLPDEHTLFELGGLTSVFTAALAERLAAAGQLDLHQSAGAYLPEKQRNTTGRPLTVLHYLTHTTGLPRLPFGIGEKERDSRQPFAYYTGADMMRYYTGFDFSTSTQGKYQFAPLNYALVQRMLEHAAGARFDALLEEKLLQPLGLHDTWLTLPDAALPALATGHSKAGQPTGLWQFQSFEAALGLKSSMHDLLIFLKNNVQHPSPLHEPQVLTGLGNDTWTACGWQVIQPRRLPAVVAITGATAGYRSALAFSPETKVGVAVLANSPYGLDGLEFLILDYLNKSLSH